DNWRLGFKPLMAKGHVMNLLEVLHDVVIACRVGANLGALPRPSFLLLHVKMPWRCITSIRAKAGFPLKPLAEEGIFELLLKRQHGSPGRGPQPTAPCSSWIGRGC